MTRLEDCRKLLLMAPVFLICGIAEMLNYNGFMTLFNGRFGSEYLPYVYTAEAFILPLEAWLMAALAANRSKPGFMKSMYLAMLGIVIVNAAILLTSNLLGLSLRWYYPFLFLSSSFVVRQQTILLWSLAVDTCSSQQAKRLMPYFVGAATLGGAAAGLLAQIIGQFLGPEAVYATGALLLFSAWFGYRQVIIRYLVPLTLGQTVSIDQEPISTRTVFRRSLASPFLLTVTFLMTLMPALYFLMEYEFFSAAKQAFPGEQAYSRYFGLVTMLLFILALLLQTVSGKLMSWLGAGHMMTAISGVYLLSYFGVVLGIGTAASLPVISIGYMLTYLLLYYSAEPSYQLFFKTLPLAQRDSYRYAIQGIAATAGLLVGAGLQFMHSGLGLSWLIVSAVGLGGAAALTLLSLRGRTLYMRELASSVQRIGEMDIAEQFRELSRNPAAMAEVRRMLDHPQDSAREVALQIIGRLQDPRDLPKLLALMDDPNPQLRIAAAKAVNMEQADVQSMAKLAAFLEDEDEAMRTEVVRQIGRMKHLESQAYFFLRLKLLDRNPAVVAEAIRSLFALGNNATQEECTEVIGRMLREDERNGIYLCPVIAELELHAFIPVIEALLTSAHPAVKISAIDCLGRLGCNHVIIPLLEQVTMMDQEMFNATIDSFVHMGGQTVPSLLGRLEGASFREWTAIVLALAQLLSIHELRTRLVPSCIMRLNELETLTTAEAALSAAGTGNPAYSALFALRRREIREMLLDGGWAILGRLSDEQVIAATRQAISHPDEQVRSDALEVLAEGIGDRSLSARLLAALEQVALGGHALQRDNATPYIALAAESRDEWLREIASMITLKDAKGGSMVGEPEQHVVRSKLEKVVFLRRVPYFANLSLEELGLLAGIAEEEAIPDGTVFLTRGQTHPDMYVVIEGHAELTSVSSAGWEGTIGVLGSGEVIGATSALDGSPSSVTAQALLGDVRALKLNGENLSRLVRLYPEIGFGLLKASFMRIRLLEEMIMKIDS